ncbi:pentatricopeptide repeat-containing protein [Tanacetum coccineum]
MHARIGCLSRATPATSRVRSAVFGDVIERGGCGLEKMSVLILRCGIGGKGTWGGVLDTDDNHIINKSELMEEAMEGIASFCDLKVETFTLDLLASVFVASSMCGEELGQSLNLFRRLVLCGERPDGYSFSMALKALSCGNWYRIGKEVHGQIVKSCVVVDDVLSTALVDLYVKSGRVGYARRVFDFMMEEVYSFISKLMEEAMEEDIYRDYGREATVQLSERTLAEPKEFKVVIEEIDTSRGKTKVQGTGNALLVTLIDEKAHTGINAIMLKPEWRDWINVGDGQLYVVVSRVKSKNGFKILCCDKDGKYTKSTTNVVYKEA